MQTTPHLFSTGMFWYVVKTKPKNEERAQSFLEDHGFITFLPWMEIPHYNQGNATKKLKPLFPNYLFARFDLSLHYPLVKWGRGINTVLGYGKYPTPISDDVIQIIKNKADDKNIVRKAIHLSNNDHIRIASGPFKDLLGIFDRWVSDEGRVRILLNLIGYQPKVELHYSQVEKICA
jgi:transcriptional antiterminator RfaH